MGETISDLSGGEIAAALIPCTVHLVTARDLQGDCVATCAWVQAISHEPSMVAVSLRPDGRTAKAITTGGCFCVNVLAAGDGVLAAACGRKGAGQPERFEAAGLHKMAAQQIETVRVEQAVSWIECRLEESRVYGDHELFIGRTLCAQTRGGLDERGKLVPAPALLMGQRGVWGRFTADE